MLKIFQIMFLTMASLVGGLLMVMQMMKAAMAIMGL
jgi:hypothetical protein